MNKKISENTTGEELRKQIQAFEILNKATRFFGMNLIEDITTLDEILKNYQNYLISLMKFIFLRAGLLMKVYL